MKYSIKDIKARSRENLLGKYSLPIAAFLLSTLIILLVTVPFNNMVRSAAEDMNIVQMLIGFVGELIISLISVLFSAGLAKIHLNIARRNQVSFADFLFAFKNHPDKFMGYGLLLILIDAACTLPGSIVLGIGISAYIITLHSSWLIVIGILLLIIGVVLAVIISLGFSLALFMLLDDPYGSKVIPAMKKSWRYMKKKKGQLFLLCLSFIGLSLLGILSLGLGLLWVEQYYMQSLSIFYLKVCEEHMEYRDLLEEAGI